MKSHGEKPPDDRLFAKFHPTLTNSAGSSTSLSVSDAKALSPKSSHHVLNSPSPFATDTDSATLLSRFREAVNVGRLRSMVYTTPFHRNAATTAMVLPPTNIPLCARKRTSRAYATVSAEPRFDPTVRSSFAMVTLAALAVVQPAALIAPFISALNRARPRSYAIAAPLPPDSQPATMNADVAQTFVQQPQAEQPVTVFDTIRNMISQLPNFPIFDVFGSDKKDSACAQVPETSAVQKSSTPDLSSILATIVENLSRFELPQFELPQLDLPRAVAKIQMAVTMRNASNITYGDEDHPFKLNGLHWHHTAISSHLLALEKRAAAGESGPEIEAAYSFVLAKVWRTYNKLEEDIFFPWLVQGTGNDPRISGTVAQFAAERDRIERRSERVRAQLRRDSDPDRRPRHYAYAGGEDSKANIRLARAFAELRADAESLHQAERDVLFPLIAGHFSVPAQRQLTNRMVYAMETRLSRLTLVNYFETIKNDEKQVANFKDEVPAPLRALLGFWKMSYYDGTPLEALHKNQ